MSFLALAPWQMWTLAGATAAIVLGLFFLKTRHPRVLVGSVVLWRRVLEEHRPDSLIERLRRLLSVLLALAIALAIAFALGQPARDTGAEGPSHLTLVLDSSASMAARTSDGRTRWDAAVDRAQQLVTEAGATRQFTFVDTTGTTPAATVENRADAIEALREMRVSPQGGRFPTVEPGAKVVFVSDGVSPRPIPDGVSLVSVFEPAVNVGVTAFEVRPIPASTLMHEVFVEVMNASGEAANVNLVVDVGRRRLFNRSLSLDAGQVHRETGRIPPGIGGILHARATTADDAFTWDDDAYAVLPEDQKVKVGLVGPGNIYLSAALEADPRVASSSIVPDAYSGKEDVDAYIFDRFVPTAEPSRPALYFAPAPRPWLGTAMKPVQDVTPTTQSDAHPLLQHVTLRDIRVDKASPLANERWTIVAAHNDTPLMTAREAPVRAAVVEFSLDQSDFATQLAFPIFLQNAVAWLGGREVVASQPLGVVRVPWTNVKVTTHTGDAVATASVLTGSVFEARTPGVYQATSGEISHRFAVNLTSTSLSAVNATTFRDEDETAESGVLLRIDWWRWLVLTAFALAALEWWTYHRRVTV